jgi:hypothetical protein
MTNEQNEVNLQSEEHAWRRAIRIVLIVSGSIEGAWLVLYVLKLMHRH